MAGTIREEIAACRAGIAALGVQNARQQSEIDAIKRALKAEPSTKRAPRKVAESSRTIRTTKRGKGKSKRSTRCNLNGCSRLFWSAIGANDHRCKA